MRKLTHVIFIALALGAGARAAGAQNNPADSWNAEASGNYYARGGAATDGAYLYVFGGYQLGARSSFPAYYRVTRRYDPVADTWTTLADLPNEPSGISYQYNAGAYCDGRLFSFGTSYQGGTGLVLEYSIADNEWTTVPGATVPLNRYGAAAATLEGRIYIIGGYAGGPTARVDAYDPATATFTQRANLPAALYLHAAAVIPWRGTVYAIGGYRARAYQSTCYQYAPSTDTWTTRAPVQATGVLQPRGYPAAFAMGDRIWLTGGFTGLGSSTTVFEYRVETDTWTPRASMNRPHYQHAAVAISGRGLVYGGLPSQTIGEEYTPPDFGAAPNAPAIVTQSGGRPESSAQASDDPAARDGWTNDQIVFTATVSDPDAGDPVRLRVRMRGVGRPAWTMFDSGLAAQGAIELPCSIPTAGPYDWEYRVEDAAGNSWPDGWAPAFGNDRSPDFRSDQSAPTAPVPLKPGETDLESADPAGRLVSFTWVGATDDGPAEALTYELEVSEDPEFGSIETSVDVPDARTAWPVYLAVSRHDRLWRVRARDIGGNAGPWSPPRTFRVFYDEGRNHAAGDHWSRCGLGVSGGAGSAAAAFLGLALLAGAAVRRIPF